MMLLRTLVFLVLLVSNVLCGCAESEAEAEVRSNTNCGWYNSNSCCSSDTADLAVEQEFPSCQPFTSTCYQFYELFSCGIYCSPSITESVSHSNSKLNICSKFADSFYAACLQDQVESDTDSCAVIGTTWSNSSTFWTTGPLAADFNYDTTDSTPQCYDPCVDCPTCGGCSNSTTAATTSVATTSVATSTSAASTAGATGTSTGTTPSGASNYIASAVLVMALVVMCIV